MEPILIGVVCIISLLVFLGLGLPIGITFIFTGLMSSALLIGFKGTLSLFGQVAYYSVASPTWTCIPLFILMGSFAAVSGFAKRAYEGVYTLSARMPGSLGIATCYGCAAFGAISGSSLAAAAIFTKLTLPEMSKYHYNKSFSVGCIASAGTFASMIPPSMMFIIYALFTQQSVGRLFAAGIIPGLITATVYSMSIFWRAKKNPKLAPMVPEEKLLARKEKFIKVGKQEWPIVLIAFLVLGGIYTGVFTPTEAAAVGCIAVLILGWQQGGIRRLRPITESLRDSANTTSMIFLINVGALFYNRVLAITGIPTELTMLIQGMDVPRVVILVAFLGVLFFLGMIMVPVGIYALTLPIIFPIIVRLGYDPIWFGVIVMKLTEIAAITPPVGLNVYAVKGAVGKNISLAEIFAGIWPFLICDIIVLIPLIMFPQISTWLPNLLLGKRIG